MIFNLNSSQIVIDGAQGWYGEVATVGPGVCGAGGFFIGVGFGSGIINFSSPAGSQLSSFATDGVTCFQGSFAGCAVLPESVGDQYSP